MFQKGKNLHFQCIACEQSVGFSLFEIDKEPQFCCSQCQKQYVFGDPTLLRQLRKFEALCWQLIESEEILGSTSVGVDVGEHHVQIPYKILLTRLNPCLELAIGNQRLAIRFRIEPCKDLQLNKLEHSGERS